MPSARPDSATSGLPRSIAPTPSIPSGGTAFTSAATSSSRAAASSSRLNSRTPALPHDSNTWQSPSIERFCSESLAERPRIIAPKRAWHIAATLRARTSLLCETIVTWAPAPAASTAEQTPTGPMP